MEEHLPAIPGCNVVRSAFVGRIPAFALCVLLCSAVVGAMNINPAADRSSARRPARSPSLPFNLLKPMPLARPLMEPVRVERVTKGAPTAEGLPMLAAVGLSPELSEISNELLRPVSESGPVPMEPVVERPVFTIVPPVPALRTLMMEVTAYCACSRCCGPKAHGVTASGHPVSYNEGLFVAADTNVLPFGTRLQIPGYADSQPVEVIDRGGAIKGNRLDVFFPTHEQAKEWGRRWIAVDVLD